ncbi:MAG: ABC transporter permease [Actinomycetota bacterium]
MRAVLRQLRFTNKAFWRNPASAFFTFAFPLMFLVIFTSLLGGGEVPLQGTDLSQSTYFVGVMSAFGVISACYTNIAITTVFSRDAGVLKRLRGTPLPSWAYLTSRVAHGMIVGAILVVVMMAFGALVYGVTLPTGGSLVSFVVAFLVGSLALAALALALTGLVPNADAAPPIVNASILPLLFISGVFIPMGDDAPTWMTTVADIFPIKHLVDAMLNSFLGGYTLPGSGIHPFAMDWSDIAVVAAWGIAGLVIATRTFSWEPRR